MHEFLARDGLVLPVREVCGACVFSAIIVNVVLGDFGCL
jgi:hypothetical protein